MKKGSFYEVICFGETLWDILPSGKMPGGAPMNVAYHLNHLGISTAMISRVGQDEWGDELLRFMRSKNIPVEFVQMDTDHPTGKVLAHVAKNEVAYDILKPVAWDFIEWRDEFSELLKNTRYFVFGSLAARSEISRKTLYQLLEMAPKKVLDINLRSPHFEKNAIEILLENADILKLNADELEIITSWYGHYRDEKDQVQVLQDRFKIKTVITTKGDKGALVLQNGAFFQQPAFRVRVENTIGSGDAFLAGYLYKTMIDASVKEALTFACALGALVAIHERACPDYSFAEIKQISQ